jgi:hypothetical protein
MQYRVNDDWYETHGPQWYAEKKAQEAADSARRSPFHSRTGQGGIWKLEYL